MKCQFCDKAFKNNGGKALHEKYCKLNPNKAEYVRGQGAGAQKGCKIWNKGLKTGPKSDRYPLTKVMVENSSYSRTHLRRRLIEDKLLPYECSICGINDIWNGKPMPLILDHINGINNDHRLENLRFVCSNCDSQLDTYKSRNRAYKNKLGSVAESG